MNRLFRHFQLTGEQEDPEKVIASIDADVLFKGTNLWILVFAIFIASLGLNVNSTAVVIGAMLVSPLMGPTIGLGLGMAINDLALLKKSIVNYLLAVAVGLAASTVFFSLSPLDRASSEILARTSPNVYDVLIALFGGFAGILAVSSKRKGNVIPGVAIATALMPPLCTAGFGIANHNVYYLFGALYLFLINTVFIALATLVTARFLKFPYKQLPDERQEAFAHRVVLIVVLVTILPSIYFGYDIVKQDQFRQKAELFIANEAGFPNDYLLKNTIDGSKISLTYGGDYITQERIDDLRGRMSKYGLDGADLEIRQGFAYLKEDDNNEQTQQLSAAFQQLQDEFQALKEKAAIADHERELHQEIFNELRSEHPAIVNCSLQRLQSVGDADASPLWSAVIMSTKPTPAAEQKKITDLLRERLSDPNIQTYFNKL
jgi:uncharacterized hydrophobic protein (TIGR00271 family)